MNIVENTPLKTHSSFAVGGIVQYSAEINTVQDVFDIHAFSLEKNLPLFVVGEGTNTLFADGTQNFILGLMKIPGIEITKESPNETHLRVGAGILWDDLVAWTTEQNLSGIEALSAIPGTAGAAPIQNIGAYGSEFKDVCLAVEAYDTTTKTIRSMNIDECLFSYRDSIFKQNPGKYIVVAVTIKLHKKPPSIPKYKDVEEYFIHKPAPTVSEIRTAIIEIRSRKLPDYKTIPNVGSYFKNPIISNAHLERILTEHPNLPYHTTQDGLIKVYAGWLIEQAGYKGKNIHDIVVYKKNALVLTNPNQAPFKNLQNAEKEIITSVQNKFRIALEREPILIHIPWFLAFLFQDAPNAVLLNLMHKNSFKELILPAVIIVILIAVLFFQTNKSEPDIKKEVMTMHEQAESWLLTNINSKGLFVYLFNPITGNTPTSNNDVRQLMASRILAEKSSMDNAYHAAHKKNLDFIFANWYEHNEGLGYIVYEDKSKLGANAMMLRTLVASPFFSTYRAEAKALKDGIISLEQPDGALLPWFIEPEYAYDSDYLLTFYSGEALLALVEYYEKTEDPELFAHIMRITNFYIDRYVTNLEANYYPAYVPWHTIAYTKLYRMQNEKRFVDAIFTMNDKLLEIQDTTETIGRFYNPKTPEYGSPHSSSDAVYLEGLSYAYEVAQKEQDQEHIERYKKAIDLSVLHLKKMQYAGPQGIFSANPDAYIGAVRINDTNPEIRVDTTQHMIDALSQLRTVY